MDTHKSDSIEDRRQKPWAMVETELLRDPSISPQCKALYGLLITYGPQSIFPGQETLAACLGATRQTVNRWLSEMRELGLIDWERRTGTSNRYYILGYANMNRDVTPTLQGCNTSVTGDVTPTLHDLDPLNQNQELEEEPPAADSPVPDDSWPTDRKPTTNDKMTAEQFKARHAHTPEELQQETVEARAAVEHPDMTVAPTNAIDWGNLKDWADRPVKEWCAFIRLPYDKQSVGTVALFAADLRTIATSRGMRKTPDETGAAIRKMTTSASCEWMRSAGRPTHKEFANVLANVLCGQVLPEGKRNGASTGRQPGGGQVQGNGFRAMPQATRR